MSDWHAPEPLLNRFVHDPGGLDHPTAASIESHLIACGRCRRHLRDSMASAALEQSWDAIADRIDRPRTGLVERLLRRVGVREETARLVSATPALSGAWLIAMVAVTVGVATISRLAEADGPFLVLAPLGPLATIAVTFAAVSDPSGEAGVPTPMNGLALVLHRATVVLVPAFLIIELAGLVLPGLTTAVVWVLPALALATGALALGTWWRVEATAGALAAAWVTTLAAARWAAGRTVAFGDVAVFSVGGQALFALLCLAAGWVLVHREAHYETWEVHR